MTLQIQLSREIYVKTLNFYNDYYNDVNIAVFNQKSGEIMPKLVQLAHKLKTDKIEIVNVNDYKRILFKALHKIIPLYSILLMEISDSSLIKEDFFLTKYNELQEIKNRLLCL